jgi:uncharacterized membrane protein
VRAEKGDFGGTSTVNMYIMPATLNVIITTAATLLAGSSTTITANVTYPDGVPASGLDIGINTPDGTLELTEISPGLYTATYMPTPLGVWNLDLSVQDAYTNTGTTSKSITITQPGIFDIIINYWYFILIAVIISGVVSYPIVKGHRKGSRYEKLKQEGQRIMKMQKELQESYFQAGEIDMETFKQKSTEYEKRLTEISEKMEKIKPR